MLYNSKALHDKVMKEYKIKQQNHEAESLKNLNELYEIFPEVRQIDNDISTLAVKYASKIITNGISPDEAVEFVKKEKDLLLKKRELILKDYNKPSLNYACNICKDTGIIDGQKCKCYTETLKKVILSNVDGSKNLTFDFENDTFDNFSLSWYSKEVDPKINISPYENMESVYRICRMFCSDFDKEKGNLYFCGSSGTGKTFTASCIANELMRKGYSIVYQSAYKLFQFMEDYKFCRIDRDSNTSMYDNIYNCDLLIIDDLCTEFGTAYTCSVLFDILNTRLINEKSTIISTNLSIGNLEKKYTDRVASRIIGNFELIRFIGDDIRIAKKQGRR